LHLPAANHRSDYKWSRALLSFGFYLQRPAEEPLCLPAARPDRNVL